MEIGLRLLLFLLKLSYTINLLQNYSFESPTLPPNSYLVEGATGWIGQNYDLLKYGNGIGFGQYIDLQRDINQNGYIQQTINLQDTSSCVLNFYYYPYDTNFNSYIANVIWNQVVVATQIPNAVQPILQTLQLSANIGNNVLRFQEIGDPSDSTGIYIDQIVLQCTPNTPAPNAEVQLNHTQNPDFQELQQIVYAFSVVFSLPFQQMICIRYAYLFVEDVWIYFYNDVAYSQPLVTVFYVVVVVEQLKLQIFDKLLGWSKYQDKLPLSDYEPFTSQKFLQIEGSSSVLLESNFAFFVYMLPQNILASVMLYALFRMLSNYKVSVFFRKFSFFKETLAETLIQGNIIYFTYVCLGHLSFPWCYRFADKMFLVHTVLFFFLTTGFTLTFFFLVGAMLEKKSSYFIYCFYRTKWSYLYLTIKNLRNFCRGFVFFCLRQFYEKQLLLLIAVQAVVLAACVSLECTRQMYTIKQFFCLELAYHFLFALLNVSLYFEYWSDKVADSALLRSLAVDFQQVLLYLLISVALLTVFLDIVPIASLKKSHSKLKLSRKKKNKQNKKKLRSLNPIKQTKKIKVATKKYNTKVVKFNVKLTKVNTKKTQEVKWTFKFQRIHQNMKPKNFSR